MKKENRNTGLSACVLVLLINASLVSLSGCGGGSENPVQPQTTQLTNTTTSPTATLTSISISANKTTLTPNQTTQFTAAGTYSDGSVVTLTNSATWTSSNTGVGTMSSLGLFSAVAPGTTKVTALKESVISDAIVVTVENPPANILPTASASASPASGTVPLLVTFIGSGSDTDGTIVKYEWDFEGDNHFDYASTTSGNTSYTYPSSGIYNAVFRVTDDRGGVATTTVSVTATSSSPPQNMAKQVAAGWSHTCALTTVEKVKCWGRNNAGQLGNGQIQESVTSPVDVLNLGSDITSISAGGYHTCALTSSGGVKCWGDNSSGQLGDGTTTNSTTPVNVTGLGSGVAAISAGLGYTCALTSSGGMKCWGEVSLGSNGGTSLVPVDIPGLTSGVKAIMADSFATCAVTASGGLRCWGYYNSVEKYLFFGPQTQDVQGFESGVSSVAIAARNVYVLMTSGVVKCIVSGDGGNRPYYVTDAASNAAAISGWGGLLVLSSSGGVNDVPGLTSGVASISAGAYHNCAVMLTGGIKCWGYGDYGKLGNGTTNYTSVPVDVIGFGG